MIKFFRGTGIGPLLLLTVITGALWAEYLIDPPKIPVSAADTVMPLWNIVLTFLSDTPLAAVFASLAVMLLLVIIMVRFNTTLFFIPRRTYLPALFYILFYAAFPGEMVLNPCLPAALFVMIGLWRMMAAYRMNGIAYNLFGAALLISFGGMFYAGALWFVLLAIIGLLILRSPDLREITITLFGALLPWLVLYAVWYLTGRDLSDLTAIIGNNLFDESESVYWSRTFIILLIVIALWLLQALGALLTELPSKKIRSRKIFTLLLWTMTLCAAVFLLVPGVSVELIALAAMPLAYVMSNYCAFTKRVVTAEIFFWLITVMIIISRMWPY
jgi:hypothetical protein